jgi:serine/threonine-protein kinase RsbW
MTEGPSFPAARMEDLAGVMAFVDAECARTGVPAAAAFAIRLATEEAFTNIIRHGYGGQRGPVRASLANDGSSVTIILVDEAPPFDPVDAPMPDVGAPLEERSVGGLGWHLVRQVMDEVHHRPRPGGGNVLTLIKHLGEANEH